MSLRSLIALSSSCERLLVLFEQALKTAADLDAEFASTNRLHGALHGIPMTVKDCCSSHPFLSFL